jgi:hypothetical protein
MADSKISALTAAAAALGTHELAVNESGVSKKDTVQQILNLAPNVLFRSFTAVGNGADTTLDTLWTFTIPAGTLAVNGQMLRVTIAGSLGANTDTKALKLAFGATTMSLWSVTTSGGTWSGVITITRVTATTQFVQAISTTGNTIVAATAAPAETLSGAIVIKLQAQDSTAATANSIVSKLGMIEMLP